MEGGLAEFADAVAWRLKPWLLAHKTQRDATHEAPRVSSHLCPHFAESLLIAGGLKFTNFRARLVSYRCWPRGGATLVSFAVSHFKQQ